MPARAGELPAERESAARSRGVRTARTCLFDTSQRTEDGAGRARRSHSAHAALSRRSVPRSVPAADAPRHADRSGAAARRRRSATRATVRADSARGRRTTRDARSCSTTFGGASACCRSASTRASIVISPDGKTALLSASAAGQANLYTLLARRARDAAGGRATADVDAGLQERTRSSPPTARRSTTSRTAASTSSTSSRGRRARSM